jgi:hypothetical protein
MRSGMICLPPAQAAPPAIVQIVDGGYDWTHRRFRCVILTTLCVE